MWIICGGNISKSLAYLCTEKTKIHVQGADLKDVLATIKIKGKDYFKDVKGLIVLDSGLESLVDLTPLNDLLVLDSEIHFMNRFPETVNANRLNEKIIVHTMKDIYLKELQSLLLKGRESIG